jgi:hypothetical protein
MPCITPADLAKRFRKHADDCDRIAAINHIRRNSRDWLTKTAIRYRTLANNIDFERAPQSPAKPEILPRRI